MPAEMNPTPKAKLLAQSFALAEGFHVPNSLPARTHNPGDLEIGDVGYGEDAGKTIFPDDQTGWDWLYGETTLMLAGQQARHHSRIYSLGDTFLKVAENYTGHDNAESWAETVSHFHGLQPTNTLQDFLDLPLPASSPGSATDEGELDT
ncbi:MAG TPA: hypothetical protein VND65_19680 [Candidatus Binatia bacterium]|nr:hypothetical protein [Candidatus Binatia bacterium]